MQIKIPDISDLLGKPYIYHTDKNDKGYDCFDHFIEVQGRFGRKINNIKRKHSGQEVFNKDAESVIESLSKEIKISKNPLAGDAIVFFDYKGRMVHIGTYLSEGRFIHCDIHGVQVSKLDSYFLKNWKVYTWLR